MSRLVSVWRTTPIQGGRTSWVQGGLPRGSRKLLLQVEAHSPPPTHTLQFPDVVEFSETMANAGKTVIVAALDGTFQRKVRLWVGAGREEGARAAQGPFSVSVRRMRAPWTTRPCRSPDNQKSPIQEQAPQMVALCGRANLGGGRSSSWLQGL